MDARLLHSLLCRPRLALAALAFTTLIPCAHAGTINLINGSFEQVTTGSSNTPATSSSEFGTGYDTLAGWSTTGYNFVFLPGSPTAQGQYGALSLWGTIPTSPDGGNYLAMDGAYEVQPVSQTINGLTPGVATTVSFFYAGAQQSGYDGPTSEAFDVSLGSQTFETPILQDASHGFTGWQQESFTFDPTSTSELLSFMAIGTPNGEPPMSLLDGVTVSTAAAPEPNSLLLLGTGIVGLGGFLRIRFRKNSV